METSNAANKTSIDVDNRIFFKTIILVKKMHLNNFRYKFMINIQVSNY